MAKRKIIVLLALCLTLLFSACGESEVREHTVPDTMESVDTGIVSQNERYALEWDNETKCVLLRDKQSKQVWSTTPYDYYQTGETSYNLSSPLAIEYYDRTDGSIQTAKAFECVDDEAVSARAEAQNLLVTFYFREAEITVTVTYSLRGDSMKISLNTSDLRESGKTNLISVSIAPYLCSTVNTEDNSSYLFIPSGSGALMYTDTDSSGMAREFSGEVYGYDPARVQLDNPGEEEPIRLPVFGVKANDHALCAIIENGDGAAKIEASAGNSRNGYSTVYATFYVRGFNNTEWESKKSAAGTKNYKDAMLLSKMWPKNREFTVGYYPLSGEDADYSGMAACYRDYLKNTGCLEKSELVQQAYHVALVGGAEVQRFTLGIPNNTFLSLTSFDQAQKILKELSELAGQTPEVILKGFGKYGMDVGQLAGGFAFAGAAGGQKGHKSLEAFCEAQNIPLFTDFDLVRFTRSGNGFNTMFNTAWAADSRAASYYPLKRNVRVENTEMAAIRLVQRAVLNKAAEKLKNFSRNSISGIGLSALGNIAYSDYREQQYMLKGGMSEQTRDILSLLKAAGHPVSLSSANGYAAGLAGSISDVPLRNGGYDALDENIPFYSMVFCGSVPLYSTALNLSANPQKELLRAVEAGVSPSFTLSHSFDAALSDSSDSLYYGIRYENNKQLLLTAIERTEDFLNSTAGAVITSHRILEKNITQTVFDNGVTVTVNHSDRPVTIDGGEIPARDFRFSN